MTEDIKVALWVGMMFGVAMGTIIAQLIESFRRYRNTSIRIEVPGVQSGSKIAVEAPTAKLAGWMIEQSMAETDRDMSGKRRDRRPPPPVPPVRVDWDAGKPDGHGGPGRS